MTASLADDITLSQTTIGGSGDDLGYTNPLTVTIFTTDDEEELNKALTLINVPKTDSRQEKDTDADDYGANQTKILDLLAKVEQRITFDGYLATGVGASDTSNTAEGKKADLKKIFLGGRGFNIKYEGAVHECNCDKLSIRRERKDGLAGDDSVAEFSVKMTVIKGERYGKEE